MWSKRYVLPLFVALAAGCAHEAYYEADEYPEAAYAQPPQEAFTTATYNVPPNSPHGAVHVVSMGSERLPAGPGKPEYYLHLRIAVENTSDTVAWTLNTGEQMAALGGPRVAPTFAQTSAGAPQLKVDRGGRGQVDLFYALPSGGAPGATLSWRLHRGNELVAQDTPFQTLSTPGAAYAYYRPVNTTGVVLGYGPSWWWWDDWYWWHGPSYLWWYRPYAFVGPRYYGYPRYYGHPGYYGHPYGGGRVYAPPAAGWRGGGGAAPHAAPARGWRR